MIPSVPDETPKPLETPAIELPSALTPAAKPVQNRKFTGGKKAVEAPVETGPEPERDFFAKAPQPVHIPRNTRSQLPVEEVEEPFSPQEARRQRRKRSLFRRRMEARWWMVPRKITRVHRSFPLRVVAGFYLGIVLIFCLVIGGTVVLSQQKPVTYQIDPPAAKETPPLQEISTLIAAKDYDKAMAELQKSLTSEPRNPRVHVMHGAVLAARRQYPEARAAFQKALDLSPGSVATMFNLAEIEFVLGDYASAGDLYAKLRPQMPDNKILLYRQYLCALMTKNEEDAQRILNSPLLPAQSPEWFYITAARNLHEGKKAEGERLVQQARLLFGDKVRPHDQTLQRLGLLSGNAWQ